MGELGLLEIGLDPDPVGRHQREQRRRGVDVVADLKLVDLGDDPVLRRVDFRVGEIELGAVERSLCVLHHRVLLERKIGVATDVGEGNGDILLLGRELRAPGFIGLPRLIELLLGGGAGSEQAFLPLELALLVVEVASAALASARFW